MLGGRFSSELDSSSSHVWRQRRCSLRCFSPSQLKGCVRAWKQGWSTSPCGWAPAPTTPKVTRPRDGTPSPGLSSRSCPNKSKASRPPDAIRYGSLLGHSVPEGVPGCSFCSATVVLVNNNPGTPSAPNQRCAVSTEREGAGGWREPRNAVLLDMFFAH